MKTPTTFIPQQHELKIHSKYFKAVKLGRKKAELRYNDRDYQTGDILILKEINEETGQYTGNRCRVIVTHILEEIPFGLEKNYVILSIEKC